MRTLNEVDSDRVSRLTRYYPYATPEDRVDIHFVASQVSPILSFVQRGESDLTDHGKRHSKEVIRVLNEMIRIQNAYGREPVTSFEARLLYLSAWLHDIGCVKTRRNHSLESTRLLKELSPRHISIDGQLIPALSWIIKYHSRQLMLEETSAELNLSDVPETMVIGANRPRMRFLAALFRLADASDIHRARAPEIVFSILRDEMNDLAVEHWLAHRDVMGLEFNPNEEQIVLWTMNDETTRLIFENLKEELTTVESILGREGFPCLNLQMSVVAEPEVDE